MRSTLDKVLSVQYYKLQRQCYVENILLMSHNWNFIPTEQQLLIFCYFLLVPSTMYLLSSYSKLINITHLVKSQDLAIFLNAITPQYSSPISQSACPVKITTDNAA